jgi:hypothetical protein
LTPLRTGYHAAPRFRESSSNRQTSKFPSAGNRAYQNPPRLYFYLLLFRGFCRKHLVVLYLSVVVFRILQTS